MKRLSILAAFFCLFLAGAAFAQKDKTGAANFAGTWELDAAKSKMGERMRVESGTLVVAQTDRELTVATDFKRAPRPENAPSQQNGNDDGAMRPPDGNHGGGMRGEGGGGRGAMMGGGNGTVSYNLNGNETIIEPENSTGAPSVVIRLKAEAAKDGKLKLIATRSFETQMGAMTVKTVDVWELQDGGKTLKISRETETPRGSQSAEMYFTKTPLKTATFDDAMAAAVSDTSTREVVPEETYQGLAVADGSFPKTISGGVLNGKTTSMPQPAYPPAARAVQASGTVNVQVTVDEQGMVVSASAVSGHPLLRAAAESAARKAEFAPVKLSGVPVKITGILIYNFIL